MGRNIFQAPIRPHDPAVAGVVHDDMGAQDAHELFRDRARDRAGQALSPAG